MVRRIFICNLLTMIHIVMYQKLIIRGGDDMEYILQTNNLSKVYGAKTVLDQVSIHVPKNSIYGLVGKNGAVGACIKVAKLLPKGTTKEVTITASRAKTAMPVPTPFPAFWRFPAPILSPTNTVTPIVKPVIHMVIILNS